MSAVRKGDVDNGEGRETDFPALTSSQTLFSKALGTATVYSLPILIIGIPVAFIWGAGTKLWQRAFRLGRRLA